MLRGAVLYDGVGPHPRIVRMCALEKGIALRSIVIDVRIGENRLSDYLSINPAGTVPALRLADGTAIGDSGAICELLDECAPEQSLLGASPAGRASTRTWVRRIQSDLAGPLILGVRAGPLRNMFVSRVPLLPSAHSDALLDLAVSTLDWMEHNFGGEYVAGYAFSLADIQLFAWVEFAERFGISLTPDQERLRRWHDMIGQRPSAAASRYPWVPSNQ